MRRGGCVLAASVAVALAACSVAAEAPPVRTFRAGAYAMDVSPTGFPVIVNGNFFAQTATETQDTLHVRWLVLDDGATRLALGVLDTCLIPANFAMHYFGSTALSADYGGVFADKLGPLLGATNAAPAFVGMMSQGTSGDQHWMDYSRPAAAVTRELYAEQLAQRAADAYKAIRFQAWVPLAMRQATLRLATRQPDDKRLAWAREIVAKKGDRLSKDWAEVYACEQLWLKENPVRDMKLQALRVGDLGIAAWPCEVFALHGLQVKAQSPFQPTMNIALANAEEGYILPPELYPLGGYNTWACRTAMLETDAGPKMVEALTALLEEVGGMERRSVAVSHGPYAQDVLDSHPLAYWRMEEWGGATALDATGSGRNAAYEPGIARWLDGPDSPAFSGTGSVNRCVHLAGGRIAAELKELGARYSAELWFWNGVPNDWRGVTGVLFSRGGDTLAIGGTNGVPGRLAFGPLTGRSEILPKTWNHVALVRDGARVAVYLNGIPEPELAGSAEPAASPRVWLGGAEGRTETFEGKLDEVALYDRALSPEDIQRRFASAESGKAR